MSTCGISYALAHCDFLLDWQKERLMGVLEEDGEQPTDDKRLSYYSVAGVVDNVLWRTMGIRLDLLPVHDRISIEQAIREATF
jgi:hypothetical protein